MMWDRLSPSELVEYHEYRKRFPYLFVCKECVRAFDSEKPVEKCKFCDGEVREIEKDDKLSAVPMKTFVCPGCYKKFIAEKAEECPRCGNKYLHSYKTIRVGTRQLLSMRKNLLKDKIKKAFSSMKKTSPGRRK